MKGSAVLSRGSHIEVVEHGLRGLVATADAIWYTNAVIGIAREHEPR
jgi:hypothetical protein